MGVAVIDSVGLSILADAAVIRKSHTNNKNAGFQRCTQGVKNTLKQMKMNGFDLCDTSHSIELRLPRQEGAA